jgi:hypothetical protein
MSNTFFERIEKLTFKGEFLPELKSVRVTVFYNRLMLEKDLILDENNSTCPFSYYPGNPPKCAAEGLLEFSRDPGTELAELTISSSAPVEKTIKIHPEDQPPTDQQNGQI